MPHDRRIKKQAQSGFTLVELMITIAILAILFGVAIPSFSDFLTRSNLRSYSIDFQADVKFASEQARMQGESVIVSTLDGSVNWKNGYQVWVDENADNTAQDTEVLRHRDSMKAGVKVSLNGNDMARVRFNRNGTVLNGAHKITVSAYPANTSIPDKKINLLASGMMNQDS